METNMEQFLQSLRQKRIAFLGIGVSHLELVRLFAERGLAVTVCDRRERTALGETADTLEALGVRLRLGPDYLRELACADVVFRTPGMRFTLPELAAYRQRGGVLTSEMEVFFDVCPCPILAVTGSDGKTTTTTLIAEMLRAQGHTVHLGGNIGRALLPIVHTIRPGDFAVVELSSFQLISMRRSPQTAVVTNITPNHLDMHADMEEYVGAKANILLHQNAFSRTVLGIDNPLAASFAPRVRGELLTFSLEQPVENGAFLRADGVLCEVVHGSPTPVLPADEIRLPGRHNIANYLAALCAVRGLAHHDAVRRVARAFGGVEHRIELVRERGGVKWYNDSIATSPTRAIAGLHAFNQKLVLLAGGYDKKIPFEPLAPEIIAHVRLLILCGDTADKIEAAVTAHPAYRPGSPKILRAENLAHAVQLADAHTTSGDIVSLSPACASFDHYPNFEARGRHFKELVAALPPAEGGRS